MIRSLNKFIFLNLLGWEVTGVVPEDKKIIAIVAPHTSWHDFFVGVFTRSVLKMENRILVHSWDEVLHLFYLI